MAPDADTSKEMALGVACKVGGFDICDTPFVNNSRGDMPCVYQVA
jgi:hypothetical protein